MKVLAAIFISIVALSILGEDLAKSHEDVESLDRIMTAYCISFITIGLGLFFMAGNLNSSPLYFLSFISIFNAFILALIVDFERY